ncbi:unnamed protein product [Leptidea sinapis]|uniref:Uncharacterized protein n=2 Tax=Leptidea sinapis TaxID=189913 RepID=A0A5E4QYX5_9NEOP|nr:unnamed protein product [Leptidea sinapis]
MFSKAKRFEPIGTLKNIKKIYWQFCMAPVKTQTKPTENSEAIKTKKLYLSTKLKQPFTPSKQNVETKSQCSSVPSTRSLKTPIHKAASGSSTNKLLTLKKGEENSNEVRLRDDIISAHETEIRNKDYTISEYNKQIEELKNEIAKMHKVLKDSKKIDDINNKLSKVTLCDKTKDISEKSVDSKLLDDLKTQIKNLESHCKVLEHEVNHKQVELTSLEDIITIRDTLCTDLQKKLTNVESCLDETRQRLEMVKGHHSLALEANESIRREYKLELETLKAKMEDEKQSITAKYKAEQENIKKKYNETMELIKATMLKEKDNQIMELQQQLQEKDAEMKAKLDQVEEATSEKLRLCEIQFEERSRPIQEHWEQQQKEIQQLQNEIKELKNTLTANEECFDRMHTELTKLKEEKENLEAEKCSVANELETMKDENKNKIMDFENQINKLTVEVDKAINEKNKYEMSLSVTRDIVHVLTMRLRESDNELEHLERQVQTLTNSKEVLEGELTSYKNTLNNTVLECSEYKEALVNILKSKAALAKEHNRIMEHNVSLIESLQNVEKEAYRELGTIKNELIEDVELIKKESKSQIQLLRDEVEKKKMLCELATEHAGHATAAAEQSRILLAQAAAEMTRLENENLCLQQQLSLLRQENEELTMNVAKQSSLLDKLKKDAEQIHSKPKSPQVVRKSHKIGKENSQTLISPLRERNH